MNNEFSLDGMEDYTWLERMIKYRGLSVGDTYEIAPATVIMQHVSTHKLYYAFGVDLRIMDKLFSAVFDLEASSGFVGPFNVSKYSFLNDAMAKAIYQLSVNKDTRQSIVQFDDIHCFNSIQFIIRRNKLTVVCSMRSCNYKANLLYDATLCAKLGEMVCKQFSLDDMDLFMQIGSLHIFKQDFTY